VKKSRQEQKHFTQRHKGAEDAKKTKQLFHASLCALASLREIVYFFTASAAVGRTLSAQKGLSVGGNLRAGHSYP